MPLRTGQGGVSKCCLPLRKTLVCVGRGDKPQISRLHIMHRTTLLLLYREAVDTRPFFNTCRGKNKQKKTKRNRRFMYVHRVKHMSTKNNGATTRGRSRDANVQVSDFLSLYALRSALSQSRSFSFLIMLMLLLVLLVPVPAALKLPLMVCRCCSRRDVLPPPPPPPPAAPPPMDISPRGIDPRATS